MKSSSIMLRAAAVLLLPIFALAAQATEPELITTRQLAQSVDLRNVVAQPNGEISGTIVNRTELTVRDVKLMINYSWVWRNDFRPGENSPGRTVYITAPAEIPPHGQGTFNYQASPPLSSNGEAGHYVPSVRIVGFTRMVPAS